MVACSPSARDGAKAPSEDLAATPTIHTRFSPQQIQIDFHLLKTALLEAHPGLYRHTPQDTFYLKLGRAIEQLNDSMTYNEFVRVVAPVLSAIGCSHTLGVHPDWYKKYREEKMRHFPFKVAIVDGGLYILENYSEDTTLVPGTQIQHLNRKSFSYFRNIAYRCMSADAHIKSYKRQTLQTFFPNAYTNFVESVDTFDLDIILPNGQKETLVVNGLTKQEIQTIREQRYPGEIEPQNPLRLKILEDNKTALLRIESFAKSVHEGHGQPFSLFLDSAFSAIRQQGATNLIIDLRDNGGGWTGYGMELYSYLADSGFVYMREVTARKLDDYSFDRHIVSGHGLDVDTMIFEPHPSGWKWSNYPNRGCEKVPGNNFSGNVYVLVNGRSLSCTGVFSAYARSRERATFIGTESGGAYVGPNGAPLVIELPNTTLKVVIPVARYELNVPGPKPGGVQPDRQGYVPHVDIDKELSRDDQELNRALKLIRSRSN